MPTPRPEYHHHHPWSNSQFDPTLPHRQGGPKRLVLCEAQNWRCCYCGIDFSSDPASDAYASIDEVVPVISGGLRLWANQVAACRLCNTGRGAAAAIEYFRLVQQVGRAEAARRQCVKSVRMADARAAHLDRRSPAAIVYTRHTGLIIV